MKKTSRITSVDESPPRAEDILPRLHGQEHLSSLRRGIHAALLGSLLVAAPLSACSSTTYGPRRDSDTEGAGSTQNAGTGGRGLGGFSGFFAGGTGGMESGGTAGSVDASTGGESPTGGAGMGGTPDGGSDSGGTMNGGTGGAPEGGTGGAPTGGAPNGGAGGENPTGGAPNGGTAGENPTGGAGLGGSPDGGANSGGTMNGGAGGENPTGGSSGTSGSGGSPEFECAEYPEQRIRFDPTDNLSYIINSCDTSSCREETVTSGNFETSFGSWTIATADEARTYVIQLKEKSAGQGGSIDITRPDITTVCDLSANGVCMHGITSAMTDESFLSDVIGNSGLVALPNALPGQVVTDYPQNCDDGTYFITVTISNQ